jgi:hypothetical protein
MTKMTLDNPVTNMLLDIAEDWTDASFVRALGDDDAGRRERTAAVLAQVRRCITLHILQTILDEVDGDDSEIFDSMRFAAGQLATRCVGEHGCQGCFAGEAETRFAVDSDEEEEEEEQS